MRIQLFSDIHLEFAPCAVPDTDADVVIAAGDVAIGTGACAWLAALGKPVVYIAGNHEFYTGEYHAVRAALRASTAGSAVHYLDNDAVVLDGVRFLGTTLWTDFGGADRATMDNARFAMNDYVQIRHGTGWFEPEHALAAHEQARAWLAQALAQPFAGPTVVVTHHAPSLRSWRGEPGSPYRHAYCNDLEALAGTGQAALWCHGHVHWTVDYRLGGTRVLCNPRGYHGLQQVAGFDAGRVLEL